MIYNISPQFYNHQVPHKNIFSVKKYIKGFAWAMVSYVNYRSLNIICTLLFLFIIEKWLHGMDVEKIINSGEKQSNLTTNIPYSDFFFDLILNKEIIDKLISMAQNYNFAIVIVLSIMIYNYLHNYISEQYKNKRNIVINDIYEKMLFILHSHCNYVRLNVGNKQEKQRFVNDFLLYKSNVKNIKYLFNLFPKVITCMLFFILFGIKIFILCVTLLFAIFMTFMIFDVRRSPISTNNVKNSFFLESTGMYNHKLQNFTYSNYFRDTLIVNGLYRLLNMTFYIAICMYLVKRDQINKYNLILLLFFITIDPIPNYQEFILCKKALSVLKFIVQQNNHLDDFSHNTINSLSISHRKQIINIPDGVTVINGRSGSGKTYLINKILAINKPNYINDKINRKPLSNQVVLITKNFLCDLRLYDIFHLYNNQYSQRKMFNYMNHFNLVDKFLSFSNNFYEIIHSSDYIWHLCASLGVNKKILICDDIDVLKWLPILKQKFQKIIITCDDKNHEYEKQAQLYINLNQPEESYDN